jgi:hypothetical protein
MHLMQVCFSMVIVHNPLARYSLPPGALGATTEYTARQVGDEFQIERLVHKVEFMRT